MDARDWRRLPLHDENVLDALSVAQCPEPNYFQCHGPVQTFLACAINHTLTATADFFLDFVIAKVSEILDPAGDFAPVTASNVIIPAGVGASGYRFVDEKAKTGLQLTGWGRLPAARRQEFLLRTFRRTSF